MSEIQTSGPHAESIAKELSPSPPSKVTFPVRALTTELVDGVVVVDVTVSEASRGRRGFPLLPFWNLLQELSAAAAKLDLEIELGEIRTAP